MSKSITKQGSKPGSNPGNKLILSVSTVKRDNLIDVASNNNKNYIETQNSQSRQADSHLRPVTTQELLDSSGTSIPYIKLEKPTFLNKIEAGNVQNDLLVY